MTIHWDRVDEITTISGGRPAVVPQKYYDDTAAEHGRLMPPVGTPTHRSLRDGNWTDPTVWDAGTVPGDGASVSPTTAPVRPSSIQFLSTARSP
jgi:hypothetical protein